MIVFLWYGYRLEGFGLSLYVGGKTNSLTLELRRSQAYYKLHVELAQRSDLPEGRVAYAASVSEKWVAELSNLSFNLGPFFTLVEEGRFQSN